MIELKFFGAVAVIEICHGKVNALDVELCTNWIDTLDRLAVDDRCRTVVMGTRGRVFSAGIDLKRLLAEDASYLESLLTTMERLMRDCLIFPKPLVADISGAAIAGGCMVATACDYRIIAEDARIGILESRLGVPLPVTAIEILRHCATTSAFREIITTGATFVGQSAVAAGLADQAVVATRNREAAIGKAEELAAIDADAFRITKRQRTAPVVRVIDQNKEQLFNDYLAVWQAEKTRQTISAYVDERL